MRGADRDEQNDLPEIELDQGVLVETQHSTTSAGSSMWLLLAAGGVLLAAAIVSWVFSGGSDDEPTAEPTTTLPPPTSTTLPEDEQALQLALVSPATVDELIVALDEVGVRDRLAYMSDENVVSVDFATGEVQVAQTTIRPDQQLRGFVLVASGNRSLALDAENGIAYLITAAGRVVRGGFDDDYVVVPDDDPLERLLTGRIDVAPNLALLAVPPGSDVLETPGLGVVILPSSGGSYIVARSGYDKLTNFRIVAASPGAWIEDRCDPELVCEMTLVNLEQSSEVALPSDAMGDTNLLSPDGQWILARDLEGSRLYDVERSMSLPVVLPRGFKPVWTEDSSLLLALRADDNGTQLWVFSPITRSTHFFDLSTMRVPPPTGDAPVPFD